MRRGWVGLIAAMLALAGCKNSGTKPPEKDAPGAAASRGRDKAPPWLNDHAKTDAVPKADSWAGPQDKNFNVASEVKGVLGGRVLDPYNRGGRDVYIRIELADATPAEREKGGAPVGIMTDASGYFQAKGLKPGRPYNLTAEAKLEGRPLYATVQTRTPNATLTLQLREDIAAPPGEATGTPPAADPAGALPPPADITTPPTARPADGAWSPGGTPATRPVPHSFGSPATPTPAPVPTPSLPPPADITPRPATKPENVADGPKDPFRAPPASIPNPVPVPVPALPPSVVPPPPANQRQSLAPVKPGANFALQDSLGRPWDFAAHRTGGLVLLDFMTSTCVPCKKALPVLTGLQERYGASGFEVMAVVCDPVPLSQRVALADKYRREQNLNYDVYTEDAPEQGALFRRYADSSTGYPFVVLLDPTGNVLWKGNPANRGALEAAVRQNLR